MRIVRLVVVLVVAAACGCTGGGGASLSSSQQAQIAKIDASLNLVGEKHFAEAEAIIQPLIHAKDFSRLSSDEQYRALLIAARLAFTLKEPQLEYESRVRLLTLPEATSDDRMARLNAASRLKNTREIIISLTDVAQKNPESLGRINYQFIFGQIREAKAKLPHGATLPLMQALYAAHWKLRWDSEPSTTWRDYALLLLEQNRLAEAIDVSAHVTDEYTLIAMRADRRFDAVAAANPAGFDVDVAAKRDLERLQSVAEQTPKSLEAKSAVIEQLRELQHYGGALAAVDGVISDIRMRRDPKQWYEDFDEQYAWILDSRAHLLRRVGRWDEAIDQMAAASHVTDKDGKNVSQVINLGDLYCDLGKPKEALDAMLRLGSDMSSYGRMQAAYVHLDAAIQLGDDAEKEKWFAFVQARRVDAPRSYEDALLRAGDSDTAAKWLIERLEDEDTRSAALLSIQDYALPVLTPREAELVKLRKGLIARADVQAVVLQVGRIESYKIEGLGQ